MHINDKERPPPFCPAEAQWLWLYPGCFAGCGWLGFDRAQPRLGCRGERGQHEQCRRERGRHAFSSATTGILAYFIFACFWLHKGWKKFPDPEYLLKTFSASPSQLPYRRNLVSRFSSTSSSDIAPSLDESIESGPLSDLQSEEDEGRRSADRRLQLITPPVDMRGGASLVHQLLEDIQNQDNDPAIWKKIEVWNSLLVCLTLSLLSYVRQCFRCLSFSKETFMFYLKVYFTSSKCSSFFWHL